MSTYSNLFSSGLLAPSLAMSNFRSYTPQPPSSPLVSPTSSGDPIDRDLSLTPIQSSSFNAMSISPERSSGSIAMVVDGQRPRLRKRRSSLLITTSPMASLKSPTRNAESALQKTGLLSPLRNRSESLGEFGFGVASVGTSLVGRIRSGSLGILRSRRVIRKASGPAPTAPLPDIPVQISQTSLPPPPNIPIAAPRPRRPLTHRLQSLNIHSQYTLHPHSAGCGPNLSTVSGSDFTNKLLQAMSTPPTSPATKGFTDHALGAPFQFQLAGDEYRIDEAMKEN